MLTGKEFSGSSSLKISESVIATIAKIAACEVEGVAGIEGEKKGISAFLVRNKLSNSIKITIDENVGIIDLYLLFDFGAKIKPVSEQVQSKVKEDVQNMTGLAVSKVNVFVTGVVFPEEKAV